MHTRKYVAHTNVARNSLNPIFNTTVKSNECSRAGAAVQWKFQIDRTKQKNIYICIFFYADTIQRRGGSKTTTLSRRVLDSPVACE